MQPIEYELELAIGNTLPATIEAALKSSSLDPVLHPSGSLLVVFDGGAMKQPDARHFVLDSFQIESLADYLRCQGDVRRALESELGEARANWLSTAEPANPRDVWLDSKVRSLYITRRTLMSAELQGKLQKGLLPELQAEAVIAGHDLPSTRSTFRVMVGVDWDEEHGVRLLIFRDGRFVGFDDN